MSDAAPAATAPTADAQEATQETFSRDYVEALRQENAAARIKAKEADSAARQEVTKEFKSKMAERDTAFTEMETTSAATALELLKIKLVLEAKVPSDDILEVADLVQGIDEESVKESVNRIKALLGKAPAKVSATDPTQGSGGTVPLNGNPVLEILKRAVGA